MIKRYATTVFVGFLSTSTGAQVVTDYQHDNVGPKEVTNAPQVTPVDAPDTTGVWYHISQQEVNYANQAFARLQAEHPDWQPSKALVEALAALQSKPNTDAVVADNDTSVKPAATLFSQLASMSEAQRKQVDTSFLQRAVAEANEAKNADFHALLGWTFLLQQRYFSAVSEFARAQRLSPSDSNMQGRTLAVTGLLDAALRKGDIPRIKKIRESYSDIPLNEQITNAGWEFYNAQKFDQALTYFTLSNFTKGQVLALSRLGKTDKAAEIACSQDQHQSLREHCASYWSLQQSERYQRNAFEQSLNAANSIEQIRALTPGETELRAWAQLKSGQHAQAVASFKALLTSQPDNQDFAYALLSAAPESEHDSLMQRFSAVKTLLEATHHQQAWQRKQFLLAAMDDDDANATPHDYGLSVYAGSSGRQRSGAQGLGNFDILRGNIGITDVIDRLRWDIRLDYEQLYSGAPAADSWFGDGQVSDVFGGITGFEDTGLHSSIQYEARALTLYGELNYALFSQPVEAKPTGQLSGTWFSDRAVSAINVYKLRVEDSLLSMGSAFFEYSDEAFGGVHKRGVRGLYSRLLADNTALSVSGVADTYEGTFTTSNQHSGVRLDLSYDIADAASDRIDYWRIGPFVSWEGFAKNRSGFTRGHGGYFSPQDLWSTGIHTELLTNEGAHWQVKASVNAGYNWIREQRAERFPASLSYTASTTIPASTSSGLAGQFTLEGQYKVSPHWLVAGYVQKAYAVEYQAVWAGLELRWHAGHAAGVTSDTLLLNDAAVSGYVF
ncbi:hypothetical protein HHX48_14520 [Salinimonas sp. HHU 13199]|uniref:Cellulose synthase operon C C-terminal domain-containing protein n=1 Tax=Salinimonas profundi TaxID=2729140 RepID=A0ABR8LMJ9_9ALTE|nr:cellulose synthase subunit BcsC-related outer membrane protein [Salinimonas profundi]MBD3586957.1 hypothetical protein [Salinimonas profundi]